MKPSPIRFLLARRVCGCAPRSIPTQSQWLATTARRHASYSAPSAPYGANAETLKRRYQPKPDSENEANAARAYTMKRMRYSAYGIILCAAGMYGVVKAYDLPVELENKSVGTTHHEAPPLPESIHEQTELVPTGTSTIPFFPRTIHIASTPAPTPQTEPSASLPAGTTPVAGGDDGPSGTEYQLLGLGIRTVSILSIQVYVVGLYVASPDIARLQERLIRTIDPVATTLVPGEKQKLRDVLLDPVKSEEIWNELIKDGQIRTAFRIVPTRNTDFMHMRDGFVRGITARTSSPVVASEKGFQDESFGQSLNDFKAVFGGGSRKKIPYGQILYLLRNAEGVFQVVYEDKEGIREIMGEVRDERVSRLLWLNYLAGKSVSSEPARQSVVEGAVEWTGRPVGTVATQVV